MYHLLIWLDSLWLELMLMKILSYVHRDFYKNRPYHGAVIVKAHSDPAPALRLQSYPINPILIDCPRDIRVTPIY